MLAFKNDYPTKAKNYRPVGVLPGMSKSFERLMHKQISVCNDKFLFPYTCVSIKSVSVPNTNCCVLLKNGKIC